MRLIIQRNSYLVDYAVVIIVNKLDFDNVLLKFNVSYLNRVSNVTFSVLNLILKS